MRVLIYTPLYRQYGQAMVSWAAAFRSWLDQQPDATFDHLKGFGGNTRLEGDTDRQDAIVRKFQRARYLFLCGDWDVFISLEDDMVLPEDAFVRILGVLADGADVAYGLYCWRHGLPWWNAYTHIDERDGRSIVKDKDKAREAWGKVVDVVGVGLGFTAITREAIKRVPFVRRGVACNDWYFAIDANEAGLVQRADTGLVCGHMTLEPSPRIIYPTDGADGTFYRTELIS